MSRGLADTSVFIAREARRPMGALPDELAVSVVTAAELELGVLRAPDAETRAVRLGTLVRVRATYALLPIDDATASCFARLADEQLRAGRRLRRHDAWIAATALRHGVAVVTQDADFGSFRRSRSCASEPGRAGSVSSARSSRFSAGEDAWAAVRASARQATMTAMLFLARLICSDVDCAEHAEEIVTSLEELDALACDCGCTLELLAVSLDAGRVAAA